MSRAKQLFGNTRVILLIVFLLLSLVAIHPRMDMDGVAIRSVEKDSAAAIANMQSPSASGTPTSREVLLSINNKPIPDEETYYDFLASVEPNRTLLLKTNKDTYRLTTKPLLEVTTLNETEFVEVIEQVFDNETNTTKNTTSFIEQNKTITTVIGTQDIGLKVYPAPTNNIQKGLDLQGGTRVLLVPQGEVSDDELDLIITNLEQRLNVFGLSDIIVRSVKDFTGEVYVLVEIAGTSEEEVTELVSKAGKFEAQVGDTVVFNGEDIKNVCRSSSTTCFAGIDPDRGCGQLSDGTFTCSFRFSISLSADAARSMAAATEDLAVIYTGEVTSDGYLSENITLLLDDEEVDSLRIGEDLKGNVVTDISISGSGSGSSEQAAAIDALANMKQLQTYLSTGSLPVSLEIIESATISPVLGEEFIDNAMLVGGLAILAVVFIIVIRYKKITIALPAIIAMLSEVIILLGFASVIGWRLDLAAIAGIIIAVGTGVDDQIVIIDETLAQRDSTKMLSWLQKLKRAFFIIMTAYFTTVVAMLPLWWSGAGLLKGFALTTIAGVTIGVLITRPAFAKILEVLFSKKSDDN
ncbi:hypothetical protein K9M74_00180 [Candidatus Woesearchaeota archaeon]|nr:hypothetical protein [Candidatus Woesearchaeota archaeon]